MATVVSLAVIRVIDSGSGPSLEALSRDDWRAARILRRIARDWRTSVVDEDHAQRDGRADLARAEAAFCCYLARADARHGEGRREPRLACPDRPALTKDERRLLRALAAARATDERLMDNYLYKIALDPSLRAFLAHAVRALATALAPYDRRAAVWPDDQTISTSPVSVVGIAWYLRSRHAGTPHKAP